MPTCVDIALYVLSVFGYHFNTIPAVVVAPIPYVYVTTGETKYARGAYYPGVITVANPHECKTMVHEFVHHWQFENYGWPRLPEEFDEQERMARHVATMAAQRFSLKPEDWVTGAAPGSVL